MNFRSFEWDERNIGHIARHGITPDEVEEACDNRPFIVRGRGGLHLAYSQTDSGRFLLVVIRYKGRGIAQVITARDMMKRERRICRDRRK